MERVFFFSSAQGFRLPVGPYSLVSDLTIGSIARSKVAEASMFHAVIKVKGWSCTFLHMFSWHGTEAWEHFYLFGVGGALQANSGLLT
jgi:hypothetical protein